MAIGLEGVVTTTNVPGAEHIGKLDLTQATNLKVILPHAFSTCYNIKGTIESVTVEKIGECAFGFCTQIAGINFPACMTVEAGAFGVTGLKPKQVTLADGCSIGKGAFKFTKINDLINDINYYVDWSQYFNTKPYEYDINHDGKISEDEKGVTITEFKPTAIDANGKVTIPAEIDGKPVLALGDWLMYTSGANNIPGAEHIRELDLTQATNLKIILPCSFADCTRLTSVIAPNITTVEYFAFENCTRLTSLNLPKVTKVGDYAFQNCTSLTSLNLPKVTKVGDYAFQDCTGLTSMTVKDGCNVLRKAFRNVPSTCTITYVDDKGDVVKTIKVSELSY